MFKTPAAAGYSYFSWLSTAGQLSPAYDYFDFATTFDGNQRYINRWYGNTMKKALENAKGEDKFEIAQKINEFNVINYPMQSTINLLLTSISISSNFREETQKKQHFTRSIKNIGPVEIVMNHKRE